MDQTMDEEIRAIWDRLVDETGNGGFVPERVYRRLEGGREAGIRLSCYLPDRSWELLIEVGSEREASDFSFPDWRGMAFDVLQLDLPVPGTHHICLRMQHPEHKDIFLSVCSDLARELQTAESLSMRKQVLVSFLDRWSKFFDRHGMQGLSPERQRGLFGELWWFRLLLDKGVNHHQVVHSWEGCERGYHDFDMRGRVVEVKTTLSKEPAKVTISNERQLDNRGLISLHLLALCLSQAVRGGESLPGIVSSIRALLSRDTPSSVEFEHRLREAGYLDSQSHLYDTTYSVPTAKLFGVREGFPRIVELQDGVGDLRYTVLLAACNEYRVDVDHHIDVILTDREV